MGPQLSTLTYEKEGEWPKERKLGYLVNLHVRLVVVGVTVVPVNLKSNNYVLVNNEHTQKRQLSMNTESELRQQEETESIKRK